ncbi:MAG: hypothetical protein LBB67_05650 [Oscillospiraceae bacterium]|nr:hypothetical protein [Oscillospiraceae bacterium]
MTKNKYKRAVCAALRPVSAMLIPVLTAAVFAACGPDFGGKPLANTYGYYLCQTDKKGETITNQDGKLIVLQTNKEGYALEEDGEQLTEAVDYPVTVKEKWGGDELSCAAFKVKVPKKWHYVRSDTVIILQKDEGNDTITYIPRTEKYPALRTEIMQRKDSFQATLEGTNSTADISIEETEVFGSSAITLTYRIPASDPENPVIIQYLVVQTSGGCVEISQQTDKLNYSEESFMQMVALVEPK